ncbi:Predicted acyltransferase, LPLAT superfamily [Chitinophaga costaii]|uniref:Predicted acyltransferase, LPLAT superfamily n=1 Tax=Chitinophaga costaii TaxID=1335309 RepID=A0A1C3ZHX2_9BACT|nr:lipid A biosynthesis acyltransferase [Chitinophaga costaii]PUZ30380.1 lipid A biosynthesis acyltransferase [Chitinophaga costaii]SCB81964.1 Predicted acyltransferase, LPLAT superfamily [Chitinophaga costaii]
MPAWEGKSKGTPLGYRVFISLLRMGGVYPAYFLLRLVSLYYCLFSFSTTKYSYRYFRRRIHFGRWRSGWAVYHNYYRFGQTIIDKVVVMANMPSPFTFEFDGEIHLRNIIAAKQGGILLSAHAGNWEVAGYLFERLQTPIHIVMYDGEHAQIKAYLESVTGQRKVHIIVIKNDLSHIYAINDALHKNELVCMHADRFMEGNKTVQVPFLGHVAAFPAGPFLLAATFKVPVCVVFAFKESATHYHLSATPPKYYHGRRQEGKNEAVHDFVQALEEKVRQYPEQWYNYYDFWQEDPAPAGQHLPEKTAGTH